MFKVFLKDLKALGHDIYMGCAFVYLMAWTFGAFGIFFIALSFVPDIEWPYRIMFGILGYGPYPFIIRNYINNLKRRANEK